MILLKALEKFFVKNPSKQITKVTGSGDIVMHAKQTLNAFITGSGDIVCKGNPRKQKTKVTGSGEIIVQN